MAKLGSPAWLEKAAPTMNRCSIVTAHIPFVSQSYSLILSTSS